MDHYVYVCKVDGEAAYIGKGKGDRWRHCLSGKSHNRKLNEAVILGKDVSVEIVKRGMSESEALSLEKSLICLMDTPYNIVKSHTQTMCEVKNDHKAEWQLVKYVHNNEDVYYDIEPKHIGMDFNYCTSVLIALHRSKDAYKEVLNEAECAWMLEGALREFVDSNPICYNHFKIEYVHDGVDFKLRGFDYSTLRYTDEARK